MFFKKKLCLFESFLTGFGPLQLYLKLEVWKMGFFREENEESEKEREN